jgi:hypothetical protein
MPPHKKQNLAKLNPRHELLALYLAAGRKPAVACSLSGFSYKYYCQHIRPSPKFKDLVDNYQDEIMEKRKNALIEDELRSVVDRGAIVTAEELTRIVQNPKTFKSDKISAGSVLMKASGEFRRQTGGNTTAGVVINIGGPKLETLNELDPDNDPDWRDNSEEAEEAGDFESG